MKAVWVRRGRRVSPLVAACAALIAVLSCGPLTEAGNPLTDGPSTETGNPTLKGIVRDTSGLRAGSAMVRLWSLPAGSGDSAALKAPVLIDSQLAKADGSYRFDSLAAGAYALEGVDGSRGLLALVPRAEIPAGDKKFLRQDTLVLRLPGTVSGIARRDGNPRPAGVKADENILVRVGGTGRAAYTDSAGRYEIKDVPAGRYALGFAAGDGHYLPKVLDSLDLPAGGTLSAPEVVLAWSPFVDPPAVAGLSVVADSAAGIVRLFWRPTAVSNFHHYEVIRRDSLDSANNRAWSTADTALADTVKGMPAGRLLAYAVVAVNALGARGPERMPSGIPVPRLPDTLPPAGSIAALVLDGSAPAKALVRLYLIPAAPASPDSGPIPALPVDSAVTGADGRAVFAGRPDRPHSLEVEHASGRRAAIAGIRPRQAVDTLRLAAAGSFKVTATRNGYWCSHDQKRDDFIAVVVMGLPGAGSTDQTGNHSRAAMPAGTWRVIVHPQPFGCFEADTVTTVILPGKETALPRMPAKPIPGFIPKVSGLRLMDVLPAAVSMEWTPAPPGYMELGGYEVVRRDADHKILKSSGTLPGPSWRDDLAGVPSGTRLNYVVRVVAKDGRKGAFGGDSLGMPIYFTVP